MIDKEHFEHHIGYCEGKTIVRTTLKLSAEQIGPSDAEQEIRNYNMKVIKQMAYGSIVKELIQIREVLCSNPVGTLYCIEPGSPMSSIDKIIRDISNG